MKTPGNNSLDNRNSILSRLNAAVRNPETYKKIISFANIFKEYAEKQENKTKQTIEKEVNTLPKLNSLPPPSYKPPSRYGNNYINNSLPPPVKTGWNNESVVPKFTGIQKLNF